MNNFRREVSEFILTYIGPEALYVKINLTKVYPPLFKAKQHDAQGKGA